MPVKRKVLGHSNLNFAYVYFDVRCFFNKNNSIRNVMDLRGFANEQKIYTKLRLEIHIFHNFGTKKNLIENLLLSYTSVNVFFTVSFG